MGYFHANVTLSSFVHHLELNRFDVIKGRQNFIEILAASSGTPVDVIEENAIREVAARKFKLIGQTEEVPAVRRSSVSVCPQCLSEDMLGARELGQGAMWLRSHWFFRPIMTCEFHECDLVELYADDSLFVFDVPVLFNRNDFDLAEACSVAKNNETLGGFQVYTMLRLRGDERTSAWLDAQSIGQGGKACEMLGSLIMDGPDATTDALTPKEWTKRRDLGFEICSEGADTIKAELTRIRRNSGRRSGRTGPQAVFGQMYRWLRVGPRAPDRGPTRDVMREVIIENFAVGEGEIVLGEVVRKRKVHSYNSLRKKVGLNSDRFKKLLFKADMIPDNASNEALNQLVFPAEEAERFVGRISNSVPRNEVKDVLGCSLTQAIKIVSGGFVASMVHLKDEDFGDTVGAFNRDDLEEFLDRLSLNTCEVSHECEGFLSLTKVTQGRTLTVDVIRWQLNGDLVQTRRIQGLHRLDMFRFSHEEVRRLRPSLPKRELIRASIAAEILSVDVKGVYRLVSSQSGEPLLKQASERECEGLRGKLYVSYSEIEKFKEKYMTVGLAAKALGLPHISALRVLKKDSIMPVRDPNEFGMKVFRRCDVAKLADRRAGSKHRNTEGVVVCTTREDAGGSVQTLADKGDSGESDGSLR